MSRLLQAIYSNLFKVEIVLSGQKILEQRLWLAKFLFVVQSRAYRKRQVWIWVDKEMSFSMQLEVF